MKSGYWKRRKRQYFGKFGKKCAVCRNTKGITLHHKIYDRNLYGNEPDAHLVPLCRDHHREFHTNHELQQNMKQCTDLYVTHAQQFERFDDNLSWI